MRDGLANWHTVCPSCRYENAAFIPTINEECSHSLINERDREAALKVLRQTNFKTIVDCASALTSSGPATLLDVGSAHGWFLEEAKTRFEVLGIEPDEAVGQKAKERGLPVRYGFFPDALHTGEQFDVIVFNDVIEHIPKIEQAINACYERLARDGILILNLPNSRGIFYRLAKLFYHVGWSGPFERMWQKDLPSPHIHYFNETNLRKLVNKHGFRLVQELALPSLRARGLMKRLRFVGNVSRPMLYAQYFAVICGIPILQAFPSDIAVSIFRKG